MQEAIQSPYPHLQADHPTPSFPAGKPSHHRTSPHPFPHAQADHDAAGGSTSGGLRRRGGIRLHHVDAIHPGACVVKI